MHIDHVWYTTHPNSGWSGISTSAILWSHVRIRTFSWPSPINTWRHTVIYSNRHLVSTYKSNLPTWAIVSSILAAVVSAPLFLESWAHAAPSIIIESFIYMLQMTHKNEQKAIHILNKMHHLWHGMVVALPCLCKHWAWTFRRRLGTITGSQVTSDLCEIIEYLLQIECVSSWWWHFEWPINVCNYSMIIGTYLAHWSSTL